jgi:transcriptional regulator with XRE-family HTH domain
MQRTPRLRELRERAALSQEDLAERSEVARATIADLEAGKRPARPSTIRKLAKGLGVEVTELYGEAEYPLGEAPPSPQRSFENHLEEERRGAEIDSSTRYARRRAEWYDKQLREAKQGGAYAGAKGVRTLFNAAVDEYDHLGTHLVLDTIRRLEDIGEPATADRLTRGLEGILDRLGETLEALYAAAEALAEGESERDELEQRRKRPEEKRKQLTEELGRHSRESA